MKRKINIKTNISILLLVWGLNIISPLHGQEIFEAGERYPFDAPPATAKNDQPLRAPGLPGLPPPGEDDKVGGAPIGDTFWIFPLLALVYGIYRKKKVKSEE